MNKKIIVPAMLGTLLFVGVISSVNAAENNTNTENCPNFQNLTFSDWKTQEQNRINNMQDKLNTATENSWQKMHELRTAQRNGDTETVEALQAELGIEDLGGFHKMRGGPNGERPNCQE